MPPSKRAVTARRAPTHDRLVAAATRVVARHGFHAATVGEIAREAGFSVGAIYSNFGGKDDLFLAVFDGHLRWFEERVEAAAAAADAGARSARGWRRSPATPSNCSSSSSSGPTPSASRSCAARSRAGWRTSAAGWPRRSSGAARRSSRRRRPPCSSSRSLRGLGMEKLADPDAVDAAAMELVDRLVP